MAKLQGLRLSQTEVSQKINLKELFGESFLNQSALAQEVGQALIDKIIKRTESGIDVNGSKFKKYSKEYIESDEFKAFGKSAGEINMTLTGQMLGTLDITRVDGNFITLGWQDSEENAKAYNHNVGDTVTKRAFFGVNEDDLAEVRAEFESKLSDKLQSPRRSSVAQLLDALSSEDIDVE